MLTPPTDSCETVYPRWRGEHGMQEGDSKTRIGLSPLARGTPLLLGSIYSGERFIPAGAGNTSHSESEEPQYSVYPRWRGEHRLLRRKSRLTSGLSPLARGTQFTVCLIPALCRFIPAGAGNTIPKSSSFGTIPVYPRWRGEHDMNAEGMTIENGLSPLARGTRTPHA